MQAIFAGLLAAFVGFASSFAVVIQGLVGVGASQAQSASGLMALSILMGVCGIALSLWRREPISVAWSTSGAALLATSVPPEGGFSAAVGAFLISGGLIVAAGLFRPFGKAVASIPPALASAMLAGVLLNLCIAPVKAVATIPAMALPVVLVWAVMLRVKRVLAVPAAVIVAVTAILLQGSAADPGGWWPEPVWVAPTFSVAATIGLALPLFVVTMASQNIPGMAVLHMNGFRPPPGRLFVATGVFSLLAAPFGGHALNLAAITAAMCAGPDVHPDPVRRYPAAIVAGLGYIVLGLMAGAATAFIAASPPVLIQAVAGLALLGSFGSALFGAMRDDAAREAAVVTFVVSASGLGFLGISGAFWGLLAGGAMLALTRYRLATGR